jgi:sugar (pentulose or hexulose) kinase
MLAGAAGPTIVEGPFAGNPIFCSALSAITGRPLEPSDSGTGTVLGALMTATGKLPHRPKQPSAVEPLHHPALAGYVHAWRTAARS